MLQALSRMDWFVEEAQNTHRLVKSSNAIAHTQPSHATNILRHPNTYALPLSPLHSLNPLRLQVSNRLMLAPTLVSPAIFFLSSLSNWRVGMSFVKSTAARRLKFRETLRRPSEVFTVCSVKRLRLEDVYLPSMDHSTFSEKF